MATTICQAFALQLSFPSKIVQDIYISEMVAELIGSLIAQNPVLEYLTFFCFIVGAVKAVLLLLSLLRPFLTRRTRLHQRYGGGCALVTGGSEGIGLGIAEELAKEGFDIVLVSRSKDKLQAAQRHLQAINPSVKVETKSIDFERITTADEYIAAFGDLLKRDISLLVNNVGYYAPNYFTKLPFAEVRREMKINMLPVAILTRLFLDPLTARKQRSGIINLSSGSAMAYYAGSSHYSASKKFVDFLSLSVGYQCADKVDLLTVRPYFVTTAMTRNVAAPSTTTTDKCAKAIVDSLGSRKYCYGPFIHNLQGVAAELLHPEITSRAYTQVIAQFAQLYYAAPQ